MFDIATTEQSRRANQNAHAARGDAMRGLWNWMFPSKISR